MIRVFMLLFFSFVALTTSQYYGRYSSYGYQPYYGGYSGYSNTGYGGYGNTGYGNYGSSYGGYGGARRGEKLRA